MAILNRKQLGKHQFVLIWGVLMWGVPTALVYPLLSHWLFNQPFSLGQLALALILFPIAGAGWGIAMWHFLERWDSRSSKEIPH